MLSSDRPHEAVEDGVVTAAKPICVALVPVVPTVHWSRVAEQPLSRADFVTQLIATAEYIPQTRGLRRGTPADANAAYGARCHKAPTQIAGIHTRQIV